MARRFSSSTRTLFVCGVIALSSVVATSSAKATPVYNEEILIVGTFSDGTQLSGYFSLNAYGYVNADWTITTTTGLALDGSTTIPGYIFSSSSTPTDQIGVTGSPTPTTVNLGGSNDAGVILSFVNPLTDAGIDPLVIDAAYSQTPNSAECYPYACNGFGGVDTPSKERILVSGYAEVPEPGSAMLLGLGLLGLGAWRRRQQ